MSENTLHRGRKYFCHYCLQAFSAEKMLKCYVEDCFKTNGRQIIKMPKKVSVLDSNIMKENQYDHL